MVGDIYLIWEIPTQGEKEGQVAKTASCKDTGQNCDFMIRGIPKKNCWPMQANTGRTPIVSVHKKTRPPERTVGTSFQLQELDQE